MKTHCPKGHALEGDNVYVDDFTRRCRRCTLARQTEYRRKKGIQTWSERQQKASSQKVTQ